MGFLSFPLQFYFPAKEPLLTLLSIGEMVKKFAIVFENFNVFLKQKDGPQMAMKLYKKLNIFKRHLKFPFSFIFVTSSACDLPVPKIMVPYPSDKILCEFVLVAVTDIVLHHFKRLGKRFVKKQMTKMHKLEVLKKEEEKKKAQRKKNDIDR